MSRRAMARAVCDPVGLAEIAERLGVKASTAHVWRYRGLLPVPWRELAIGPIWDWPAVLEWAKETGRSGVAGGN